MNDLPRVFFDKQRNLVPSDRVERDAAQVRID